MNRFGLLITGVAVIMSFCLAPRCVSAVEANNEFGPKIAFETYMEERLKATLTEIVGTDKLIVVVNADVDTSKRSASAPSAARRGVFRQREGTDALVLPGVPAKKDIGKSPTQTAELSLPEAPQGGLGAVMVRHMAVTVLLDKSVPASMIDVVREVAANVVDFSQSRGDRLDIKQLDIKKINFRWASFLYPPHLYWLVLIITGGLFLIAASLFLMNPYIRLSGSGQSMKVDVMKGVAASGALAQEAKTGTAAVGSSPALVKEGQEEPERSSPPFAFIKERHIRDISFLLKNEPLQSVATVVNYIDPELAIKLLNFFPEDRQADIALSLTSIAEVDPGKIQQMEEKLKDRLGFIIGGEDKAANILDMLSDDVRDRVFSLVDRKDSDAAKRLRQRVRDLESFLREMSSQGIQTLYREMDHALFAQILKTLPGDIQKKVSESLSKGAAELLKQEMDLSRPVSPVRLKTEKRNMLMTIRRMIREGLLEVGG